MNEQLARNSNEFGFDLYRRQCQKPGNLVMSPASVTIALTMTWAGARGETAAQMRKVLHLEGTEDGVMTATGELASSLQDPSRPGIFRIANQLFVEKTYELAPAFVETVRQAFGAPVELLDFQEAPEPSRVHINEWVESKTERRIRDLIPPRAIEPDTRLVLANAIYFLGDWEEPFPERATHPAPFHLTASETKDVPTMHRTDWLPVGRKDGVTALAIPYEGGDLFMIFLVPDKVEGLAALEGSLDGGKLQALLGAMERDHVQVSLPKFEVNPAESMSLAEDLKALGMPAAFDRNRADFTGIANPPDPEDRLVISKVFHKGFVRVDEKGTEAAAATAVVMNRAGSAPGEPRELKIDRPFLFLILDNASGLVLFLGRVSDPSPP